MFSFLIIACWVCKAGFSFGHAWPSGEGTAELYTRSVGLGLGKGRQVDSEVVRLELSNQAPLRMAATETMDY